MFPLPLTQLISNLASILNILSYSKASHSMSSPRNLLVEAKNKLASFKQRKIEVTKEFVQSLNTVDNEIEKNAREQQQLDSKSKIV
jgi:hypothetical protein